MIRHRSTALFLAALHETARLSVRSASFPLALHDDPAGAPPAPEGGAITIMPSGDVQGAPRSAVEQASQAARERLAETGTALPPEPGAPAKPAQPRASDGTFAPPLPEEVQAENERKAAAAAAAANGEQPPEGEQVPAAEAEKVVEIVGEDGTTLPIEFDDPAVAEQVRERFEIAAQAERIEAEARRALDDVLAVREAVNVDPVGFVMSEIGTQPAAVEHLVLSLLTAPEHKPLLDRVAKIASDANELRIVAAEQKAARTEYREQAQSSIAESRAVEQNLGDLKAVVTALLPRDITPEAQRVVWADMMRDLQQYADRHNLTTIPVEDIPLVLRNRLTANGLDPMDAAQKAAEAVARRRSGKGARRGSVAAPATPKGAAAAGAGARPAASRNGSAFVASAESRKAVVTPAAGAGSPGVADLAPPRKADGSPMSIEETIAFHRGRLNKGIKALPVSA